MKGKIKWLIGLGLVAALLIPALGIGTALAEDPTPTPNGDNVGWWCGGAGGMMGGFGLMHGGLLRGNLDRLATALGVTTDELTTQLREGKTLKEIAEAKGVSESKLVDTILAPIRDMTQVMVKYGYISEQQATDRLTRIEEQVKAAISQPLQWNAPRSGGFRGMMGPGMMGGYGNQGTSSGLGGMMQGLGRTFQGGFGMMGGL